MENLDRIIESLKQPMTDTLAQWIKVPSIKGEKEEGAPFGRDVRAMLDTALETCRSLGFDTKDVDGYAMHADMGEGDSEDALAILAHLDVVPVGDGWSYPPFGAVIEDGKMYGRGTGDDKGPAVAALYAMKAVQLAGIPLKRKVRLILGCDEESGWEDMAYYTEHETMPRTGFSPDADYPVINIEKGMVGLELRARLADTGLQIIRWATGERTNVIPGHAEALVKGGKELIEKTAAVSEKYGWPVRAEVTNEGVLLTAEGIPGHAAYPEAGRNAIGQLLITLKELGAQGAVSLLADAIGTTYYGEHLGAQIQDGLSGKLTCNLGILRVENGGLFATLDMRCPILTDRAYLVDMIKRHLPGIDVTQTVSKAPHYVPEQSELVTELLNAYHEVTGLPKKALAIGGGTYAKVLKEGVAFGASFPGDPELAHQANEYITLDSLYRSMTIFARAIVRLAGK